MKISNPIVSVVIPVYNRETLIKRAIYSIINQTYSNLEILVIDDGSADKTAEKVKEIHDSRIKYYKIENNSGVAHARNKGVELSNSEYIVFMDSDDESYPDRIEKKLKLILTLPEEYGAVYCGREIYNSHTGEKIGEKRLEVDFKKNFTEGSYFLTPGTGTLMMKKKVFEEVGYFDSRLRSHEDTEMAIRVSQQYKYAFLNEVLVKVYRYHSQITNNNKAYIDAKEIILEKHSNYLSKKILFGLCKIIANYYILTDNVEKALYYIKLSLRYQLKPISVVQLAALKFLPGIVKNIYQKKYKGDIPLTSGIKPLAFLPK